MHYIRWFRLRSVLLVSGLLLIMSCDHRPLTPAPKDSGAVVEAWSSVLMRTLRPMPVQWVDGEAVRYRSVVDDYPAWSPDDRFIAFHRRYASSYGPPGLYIIPSHGGVPRLLLQSGAYFPREMSFSPDGRRLVCSDNSQLVFIDLDNGMVSRPMYTDNGASYPDWSPDGRTVAYLRIFLSRFPSEPPDSAGLHLLDVATGQDRPLWSGFGAQPAGPSRWVRNGKALAVIHNDNVRCYLKIVDLDGIHFDLVTTVPSPKTFWNLQHLGQASSGPGSSATESLIMLVLGRSIERTLHVTLGPIAVSDRRVLGLWDVLSHDGRTVVAVRPDPTDSLGVLYVGRANGPPKARMLQLTHYGAP